MTHQILKHRKYWIKSLLHEKSIRPKFILKTRQQDSHLSARGEPGFRDTGMNSSVEASRLTLTVSRTQKEAPPCQEKSDRGVSRTDKEQQLLKQFAQISPLWRYQLVGGTRRMQRHLLTVRNYSLSLSCLSFFFISPVIVSSCPIPCVDWSTLASAPPPPWIRVWNALLTSAPW